MPCEMMRGIRSVERLQMPEKKKMSVVVATTVLQTDFVFPRKKQRQKHTSNFADL
jgi:hypothetical protein